MTFPAQPHSAEKVQHDIHLILEAIARFLAKVDPPEIPVPEEPLQIKAELEGEEEWDVIDVEVIPEYPALSSWNPKLLRGGEDPDQLQPVVQLQIDGNSTAVLVGDLPEHLRQLPSQQVHILAEAIQRPALPPAEVDPAIAPEVIDIQVNGEQCFHRENGQVIVNALLSPNETQRTRSTTITTEIGETQPEQPTIELRPAAEVEALTGQELGDSSVLHSQVIYNAPAIRVERDQYGHIKGGAAVRAFVEPTEDSVEADVEYRAEHPLTPEAKAVVAEFQKYCEQTGQQVFPGENFYDIHVQDDRVLFVPKSNPEEAVVVRGDRAESISAEQIERLMVRFAAAYETLSTRETANDFELTR